MLALVIALVATHLLIPAAAAATAAAGSQYTVWSSVVFSRTGDRTPSALGDLPLTLTSLGAQQQYALGSFFRARYLADAPSTDGIETAPVVNLSSNAIDNSQMYILALDDHSNIASAQAFLQGLYPPFTLANSTANPNETAPTLDPESLLANGTYLENPLGGFQYPLINTAGPYDPESVYIGNTFSCPAWTISQAETAGSNASIVTEAATKDMYSTLGSAFLGDVLVPSSWNYFYAYDIFDYLNYQNTHNATAYGELSNSTDFIDPASDISDLDLARYYADAQQFAALANYASSDIASSVLPNGAEGTISTIAGNALAARILAQFQIALGSSGAFPKLSLLFSDYQPLVSLFALLQLPSSHNPDFYGLPAFSSIAAFELFSYEPANTTTIPDPADLYVRFLFRNGSANPQTQLQSFTLFSSYPDPDSMDMSWADFSSNMARIALESYEDWCVACQSQAPFCTSSNPGSSPSSSSSSGSGNPLSPVAAGVVGAIVALAVAGLVFAALALCAGVRLHRVGRRASNLGGFKGSRKLASDRDLVLPGKSGAVVVDAAGVTSVEDEAAPGCPAPVAAPASVAARAHERSGSWEMKAGVAKGAEAGLSPPTSPTTTAARVGGFGPGHGREDGFDEDEIAVDPFREPVRPEERV